MYMTIYFMGALMSDYAALQDDTCSEPGAGIPGDPNIPSNYVSILSTNRKISIFLNPRPVVCRCMTGSFLVCSSHAEIQRCAKGCMPPVPISHEVLQLSEHCFCSVGDHPTQQ